MTCFPSSSSSHAVPQFNITPKNSVVSENDPDVEICVISDSPLAREVTVIAQTLPKEGDVAQAMGKITFMHANKPCLCLILTDNAIVQLIN